MTAGRGEDYSTGCLLDNYYIKKHYGLIAVDLSREKELDADLKAIQQIEFVEQLKNVDNDYNAIDADGTQSMFILSILENIKET